MPSSYALLNQKQYKKELIVFTAIFLKQTKENTLFLQKIFLLYKYEVFEYYEICQVLKLQLAAFITKISRQLKIVMY